MIDPVQAPTAAAPSASIPDVPASSSATDVGAIAGAQKTAALYNSSTAAATAQTAQTAASSRASDSPSESDAVQPLRLLIEHDNSTNHYVYKLYDSSGRIVREIPQESLADAQKQAGGFAGALLDTKV
jgi:uncharacterized FlaG/YvyC family protein